MRSPCLDEGILQGYCDGELDTETLEHVVSHLSSCEACTHALREVESEMEMANAAFASELSLSVPSERLRARLDEAIAGLPPQQAIINESTATRLRAWFASLAASFNFTPQGAIGFASIVAFLVLAAVVGSFMMRQRDAQTGVAIITNQDDQSDLSFKKETPVVTVSPDATSAPKVLATHRPSSKGARKNISSPLTQGQDVAALTPAEPLPTEKNYLNAIALLSETIEANGDTSLQPALLSDYKRNLAVIDQAITATQRTARSNPKSADAAEMLFAVYQSKLDLLTAVAEQSRPLIAQR